MLEKVERPSAVAPKRNVVPRSKGRKGTRWLGATMWSAGPPGFQRAGCPRHNSATRRHAGTVASKCRSDRERQMSRRGPVAVETVSIKNRLNAQAPYREPAFLGVRVLFCSSRNAPKPIQPVAHVARHEFRYKTSCATSGDESRRCSHAVSRRRVTAQCQVPAARE